MDVPSTAAITTRNIAVSVAVVVLDTGTATSVNGNLTDTDQHIRVGDHTYWM